MVLETRRLGFGFRLGLVLGLGSEREFDIRLGLGLATTSLQVGCQGTADRCQFLRGQQSHLGGARLVEVRFVAVEGEGRRSGLSDRVVVRHGDQVEIVDQQTLGLSHRNRRVTVRLQPIIGLLAADPHLQGDDVAGMKVAFLAATSSAVVLSSASKSGTETGPCVVPLSLIPNAAIT